MHSERILSYIIKTLDFFVDMALGLRMTFAQID